MHNILQDAADRSFYVALVSVKQETSKKKTVENLVRIIFRPTVSILLYQHVLEKSFEKF